MRITIVSKPPERGTLPVDVHLEADEAKDLVSILRAVGALRLKFPFDLPRNRSISSFTHALLHLLEMEGY